ncbi:hypothetical protein GCM10027580_07320 [Corynebacterium faecale]
MCAILGSHLYFPVCGWWRVIVAGEWIQGVFHVWNRFPPIISAYMGIWVVAG